MQVCEVNSDILFIAYNHRQIHWDKHEKTNIFENYFHILQKTNPPPPQNNVAEHLNH